MATGHRSNGVIRFVPRVYHRRACHHQDDDEEEEEEDREASFHHRVHLLHILPRDPLVAVTATWVQGGLDRV